MKSEARLVAWLAAVLAIAAPAAAGDLISIRTPSDNIHCMFYDDPIGGVTCEIAELTPSPALPAKPADCDLDYGHRFSIGEAGVAEMVCYGDSLRVPSADILDYGAERSHYGVTCESSKKGLTCQNENGRGFFLSRSQQDLF